MANSKKRIAVGLVDDQTLFREAIASIINRYDNYEVILSAKNGKDMIDILKNKDRPNIILLDLNMPIVDGFDSALWLHKNIPQIPVLILTMHDLDVALIRLVRLGIRGFLKKDIHPDKLKDAIEITIETGYYYGGETTAKVVSYLNQDTNAISLTDIEFRFLELACSELTYKQIAERMGGISPRTVDNYRDSLFTKLSVDNRIGLVLYAMRNGLIHG